MLSWNAWRLWRNVRPVSRKRSCRLSVEALETRATPTANVTGLSPATDSGVADGITNDSTPTIVGIALGGEQVEVFNGATSLGMTTADANGNWSFDVPAGKELLEGANDLSAEDMDGVGVHFTATLDTIPPAAPSTPTLTSDTGTQGDGRTNDPTPTISGTAAANSTIKVFDGGLEIGQTTSNQAGSWSFSPATALGEGSHTFTATAADEATNTSGLSGELTIFLDLSAPPAPPAPTLTTASDTGTAGDNTTRLTQPIIQGTAEPNSTIQVFDGGTALPGTATADGTGAWTFTPSAPLSAAVHTLTVRATDTSGNVSDSSAALALTVDTSVASPSALAVDPTSDTGTAGDNRTTDTTPTITGTGEANATVEVFDGSTSLGTVTANAQGAWSFTPQTALTEGAHSITARATDVAGNVSTASATLTVTVDVTNPTVPTGLTLAAASDSGTTGDNRTNDTTPTISGTAEANAIVELFEGATSLGTATANSSGVWSVTPTTALTQGAHTLTATARDGAGNVSAASVGVTVTIDTTAPTPPSTPDMTDDSDTGVSETDDITARTGPTFTGTAEAGSTLQIFDGSRLLGTTVANSAGAWSFVSPQLADGPHMITATAVDVAGNTSTISSGRSITIDSTGQRANPLTNVTSRVRINRSKIRKIKPPRGQRRVRRPALPPGFFRQTITITNTTGRTMEGPMFFALDNLTRGVSVVGGQSGRSPFLQVLPNGGLAPGQSFTFTLTFVNLSNLPIRYDARVMTGFGAL